MSTKRRKVVVDGFAGGGGASEGICMALGRSPDYGYNHDVVALAMHCVNHPETRHFSSSIWRINPDDIDGEIGLAWFSPDCKHFSRAKGGKPVDRKVHDLAWVVVKWARRKKGGPEVIILENVLEFTTWGPLLKSGMPNKARAGETFARWVKALQRLGYVVEWKARIAADAGAPTLRKRLFVIARRDGRRIVWTSPKFAKPAIAKKLSIPEWKTAAEHVIDWSLTCPSIFDTAEEIKEKHGLTAQRPLKPKTLARIARGIFRFVIDHPSPYIISCTNGATGEEYDVRDDGQSLLPFLSPITHGGDGFRGSPPTGPVPTVTTAHRGEHALITPFVTKFGEGSVGHHVREPFRTATANSWQKKPGGAPPFAVVAPTLIQTGYGERPGQAPRSLDLFAPLGTPVAGGSKHAVVAAFLAQHNGGEVGRDLREPVSTIVQRGPTQAVVSAGLLNLKGSERRWAGPLSPAPTQCAGGWHQAAVAAFLVKYHESGGRDQDLRDPLHTQDCKGRFGLVVVMIEGEPAVVVEVGGQRYVFTDIGMRMLTPRELFRAQGFRDDYVIDRGVLADWRLDDAGIWRQRPAKHITISKTDQIRMCGNSVSPCEAQDLVAANCPDLASWPEAAE